MKARVHRASALEQFLARSGPIPPAIARSLPELRAGMLTIGDVTDAPAKPGTLPEWNPVAQTLWVGSARVPTIADTAPYRRVRGTAHRFVAASRALLRILVWEPFHSGQIDPFSDREEFATFVFLSEGFCSFYADAVVYRRLWREVLCDENVRSDSLDFGGMFNPRSLLVRHGYRSWSDQLGAYIGTFGLLSDWQSRHSDDEQWKVFRGRIYSYRLEADHVVTRWFEVMRDMREFRARFCGVPSLPRAFEHSPKNLGHEAISSYLLSFRRALAALEHAPTERVRLRREVQSRAYFLYQLQSAHQAGHLLSADLRRLHSPVVSASLSHALDGLETGLLTLARGKATTACLQALRRADAALERGFAILRRAGAFVACRELSMTNDRIVRLDVTGKSAVPPNLPALLSALAVPWREAFGRPEWVKAARSLLDPNHTPSLAEFVRVFSEMRARWTVEPALCYPPSRELLLSVGRHWGGD